ncbi:MAG: hypothetical protein ACR2M8_02790 [Pyrinomonadaceae bacterium]|nr:hypothetical protein [Acidobacteriota bacterium]MDQ3491606.1 hypothetical protein [Acidobacteriota bacterium]
MQNISSAIIITLIILAVMGCGMADRVQKTVTGSENTNSNVKNKTLTDSALETVAGEDKFGVSECDEVMDFLVAQANDPDDNFVTKAVKTTLLNKFRDRMKRSIEEQKANKVELAKTCKDFKRNLDTSKAEEESNKQ